MRGPTRRTKYTRRDIPIFADGQHLRAARTFAGLQQKELAELCGCHETAVRYWESMGEPFSGHVPKLMSAALLEKGVIVSLWPATITAHRDA